MNAISLISDNIPPLKTSDTGEVVMNWMNEFQVKHLPIVNNEQFLGLISEEDILDNEPNEPIGSYSLSYYKPYVLDTDHLFTVLKVCAELRLTIVPVVDKEMNYQGLVPIENLMYEFARMNAVSEPGGIIVLEVGIKDFYLSEIGRIVESNDAKILCLYTSSHDDSTKMELTIKLNRQNINNVVATFERFDYKVISYYQEQDHNDFMKERYDSFIKYMNI